MARPFQCLGIITELLRRVARSVVLCLVFASIAASMEARRYSRTAPHMGTQFEVILYTGSAPMAERAFDAAFARIKELDLMLSSFQPDSEVNRICRSAPHDDMVAISPDLYAVLAQAQAVSQLSHGAFDVTIGPLSRLWRRARRL